MENSTAGDAEKRRAKKDLTTTTFSEATAVKGGKKEREIEAPDVIKKLRQIDITSNLINMEDTEHTFVKATAAKGLPEGN